MLAMLKEKTKGNLALEELRLLENGLTELRFRYVQVASDLKQAGQKEQVSAGASAPADTPFAPSPDASSAASTVGTATAAQPAEPPRIIIPDGGKGTKSV
jgi:hypothetical protein